MRAKEFFLSEAAMNPNEFKKAISSGHDQGVKVGFEFEVCMSSDAMSKYSHQQPSNREKTTKEVADLLEPVFAFSRVRLDSDDPLALDSLGETGLLTIPKVFDHYLKLKDSINAKYNNITDASNAVCDGYSNRLKLIWNTIPKSIKKEIFSTDDSEIYQLIGDRIDSTVDCSPLEIVSLMYWTVYKLIDIRSRMTCHKELDVILYIAIKDFKKILLRAFQSLRFDKIFEYMLHIDGNHVLENMESYFDFDPNKLYDKFNLASLTASDVNNLNPDKYDNDYPKLAYILKNALETKFNVPVIVFKEYHQKTKDLTSWYVEPDVSLTPDSESDGAAEVVTPPMPANEAMQALKNFYRLAQELHLYTDSLNQTSLHINISIPKELDIVKLVAFLGDQYVLRQFGRSKNVYAKDALTRLRSNLQGSHMYSGDPHPSGVTDEKNKLFFS